MQFSVRGLIASTGIVGAVSAIVVLNLTKCGAQNGEGQDDVEVFFATVGQSYSSRRSEAWHY